MRSRMPAERYALAQVLMMCFPKINMDQAMQMSNRIANLLTLHHAYVTFADDHRRSRRTVDPFEGMSEIFRMYEDAGRTPWIPDGEPQADHR